jgi:hypothetical protein
LAEEALQTIKDKEYDKQYKQTGQKVADIGAGVFLKGKVKAIFEELKEPISLSPGQSPPGLSPGLFRASGRRSAAFSAGLNP